MTKISGKISKKIIYFKMSIDQKSIFTPNFMLIPMQKPFFISTIIFKSNGNVYLYLAFLAQNGTGTVQERKNYCNLNSYL